MAERARRHRGQGTITQRPNGTWMAQIDLPPGPDGKRRRKTVYAPTHPAILTKIDQARSEMRERGDLPTADMTVEKWLDYWLPEIAYHRTKPRTYTSYRTEVRCHITPTVGKVRLGRLNLAHIRDMHKTLRASGLSATTVGNAHRVLSAALNDAVREGRVGRNVAALVPAPKKARSGRRGLDRDAAIRILRHAGQDRIGSRWLAAFLLGSRQGELLGLRWTDLDLDAGLVDVSWALSRVGWAHGCDPGCGRTARTCPARRLPIADGFEYETLAGNLVLMRPKSADSRRVVPLPAPLLLALRHRRDLTDLERPGYLTDHDLVWCQLDGKPLDPRRDWQAWTDLLDAAGVPHVTLHEARHTTATLLLDAKVDARIISEILGHSDVVVTRGYQHVDTALSRKALDELGASLSDLDD